MTFVAFLLGMFVGATVTLFGMAIFIIASEAEKREEEEWEKKNWKKKD